MLGPHRRFLRTCYETTCFPNHNINRAVFIVGGRTRNQCKSRCRIRARPQNLLAYNNPDICDLAASFTSGIIRNHPLVDGNKRTAFMAGYVFLACNGLRLTASELDVFQVVTLLAASEIEESNFAAWLRENCEST